MTSRVLAAAATAALAAAPPGAAAKPRTLRDYLTRHANVLAGRQHSMTPAKIVGYHARNHRARGWARLMIDAGSVIEDNWEFAEVIQRDIEIIVIRCRTGRVIVMDGYTGQRECPSG